MTESNDVHQGRRKALLFKEATGKTVASIQLNEGAKWRALEVRFTDETFFWFELVPRIGLEVRYMEERDGDVGILRDYGFVPE